MTLVASHGACLCPAILSPPHLTILEQYQGWREYIYLVGFSWEVIKVILNEIKQKSSVYQLEHLHILSVLIMRGKEAILAGNKTIGEIWQCDGNKMYGRKISVALVFVSWNLKRGISYYECIRFKCVYPCCAFVKFKRESSFSICYKRHFWDSPLMFISCKVKYELFSYIVQLAMFAGSHKTSHISKDLPLHIFHSN